MKTIGHRGARGLAPENTIAALQKGLEHHVDMLEFDLRVTKDRVVILHHGSELIDPNGEKHQIIESTYGELKAHKPDLATFEEALAATGRQVPLYVEVKGGVDIKPIVTMIKQQLKTGWKTSDFLLGSKSQKTLVTLHAALPDIQNIVIEPWSGIRATRRARQVGTHRLSMDQLWLWWGFIRAMRRGGWELYAYTVNDPAKAKRWAHHGLAGVVTDYPDLFTK
jgi:glycerophosphoryl diester phosphodiesterase